MKEKFLLHCAVTLFSYLDVLEKFTIKITRFGFKIILIVLALNDIHTLDNNHSEYVLNLHCWLFISHKGCHHCIAINCIFN